MSLLLVMNLGFAGSPGVPVPTYRPRPLTDANVQTRGRTRARRADQQSTISPDFAGDGLVIDSSGRLSLTAPTTTTLGGVFSATPFTALTDSSGGTADDTVAAVSGSGDDTNINNNFADVTAKINSLRTALVEAGIL